MPDFLSVGRSGFDLLLVVLGFGFIIFVHELGHFLAAKWAGIRVLAFAIGFGPAAVSYRQGLGWRRGSSEREYLELIKREKEGINPVAPAGVSSTEYRLNWLPLGGYVKMLGQEDLNPGAVSTEKDSYQNTPVWKRMVVISAGVVMNVLLAAVLFIAVFMRGLETEPPVVGAVEPGSPAALAVAENAGAVGVTVPGLQPGDTVLEVNGRTPREFTDLIMASAMTSRDAPVSLVVQRPGAPTPLRFEIRPREGRTTRLLEMGIEPSRSAKLLSARTEQERAMFAEEMAKLGLPGVMPGMTLTRVGDDRLIADAADLAEAMRRSGGAPVPVEFRDDAGTVVAGTLTPRPMLEVGYAKMPSGQASPVQHLLGLTPVLRVNPEKNGKPRQGLEDGDVFARLGAVEFPGMSQGVAEIRRHKGQSIEAVVLRDVGGSVVRTPIVPAPKVQDKNGGTIGFYVSDTSLTDTILSVPPLLSPTANGEPGPTAAAALVTRPGTRVVDVGGTPVHNFAEIREALLRATAGAPAGAGATVELGLQLPLTDADGTRPVERARWELSAADLKSLRELGWTTPLDTGIFEPATYVLKASGPLDAIRMGLHKTQRVMVSTYLTFARLYEGTVKVEHLKGPVGIAHMGTRIAERGPTWLLFFMALISVNLAVINFLPLPIVDGGQFLFLVLEQIRGKPVSVEVQNVATVLGLVLIGAVFLIVTFHDITGLFAG